MVRCIDALKDLMNPSLEDAAFEMGIKIGNL